MSHAVLNCMCNQNAVGTGKKRNTFLMCRRPGEMLFISLFLQCSIHFNTQCNVKLQAKKKQFEGKHINKDMREGIIANGSCNESPTNEIKFFKTAIRKSSKRLFVF